MQLSGSEQRYIRNIYEVSIENRQHITTNSLSKVLEIKPPSVSEMLKRLAKKNLLDYRPYKAARLTKLGEKAAIKIIRRRRLWETFLAKELEMDWLDVSKTAADFESIENEFMLNTIDKKLNYPRMSPFGKLIPNKNGLMLDSDCIVMNKLKPGSRAEIMGIISLENKFLKEVKQNKIAIGKLLKIKNKDVFDHSISFIIDKNEFQMSEEMARKILVRKTSGLLRLF